MTTTETTTENFFICICYNVANEKRTLIQGKEFSVSDLKEFRVINNRSYKRDGGFKKFILNGLLFLKSGEAYRIGVSDTKELKRVLKPFAKEITKAPQVEYKGRFNSDERKAIDYVYAF